VSKTVWRIVVIVLVLVIAATGALGVRSYLTARAGRANMYATAPVTRGSLKVTVDGTGVLQPARQQSLSFGTAGTVSTVRVQVGQEVRAGEVLATLRDDNNLAMQLLQAQSQLAQAQSRLQQLQNPAATTSADTITAAQLRVQAAQLQVDQAQSQLTKLNITAPGPGLIGVLNVKVGDNVNPGQQVATIYDDSKMLVQVTVTEDRVLDVASGDHADVTVHGLAEPYTGHVTAVATTASGQNKAGQSLFQVTITLDDYRDVNNGAALAQGMGADVTIYPSAGAANTGSISTSGTVAYNATYQVVAQVAGTVASVPVAVGDRIKAGALVSSLSSDSLQSQYQQALNSLQQAQVALHQVTDPAPSSAQDIESQQYAVEQAMLNVEARQSDLNSLSIAAPFDGVVTSVNVNPGDRVAAGAPVVTVVDISHLQVVASISELQIAQVAVGQKVTITADALPGTTWDGIVTAIAPVGQVQNGVGNFDVTIDVANPGSLRAGMSCNASIFVASHDDVLMVPAEAVSGEGDQAFVQVLVNNKPELRHVTVGLHNDAFVEITSGLQEGEVVITGTASSGSSQFFRMPGGNFPEPRTTTPNRRSSGGGG